MKKMKVNRRSTRRAKALAVQTTVRAGQDNFAPIFDLGSCFSLNLPGQTGCAAT